MAIENITGATANIEEQLKRIADALERIADVMETQTEYQPSSVSEGSRNIRTSLAAISSKI